MPNIRGIDLSDGITILGAEDLQGLPLKYSASKIEAYLASHTIAQAEADTEKWLNANWFDKSSDQIKVHIISTSPLKVTCIVAVKYYSDETGTHPYVIPDNWWE